MPSAVLTKVKLLRINKWTGCCSVGDVNEEALIVGGCVVVSLVVAPSCCACRALTVARFGARAVLGCASW